MKKKTGSSDVFTKDYFDEALDIRLEMFKDEIIGEVREIVTESTGKLYTRIDPLLSEIVDNREDRAITTNQIQKLKVRVDNHEARIKKLETN